MRSSGRVLFILGLVLAVVSALGLYYLVANSKPPPATVPTTKLVIAFQQVAQRSEVGADEIGLVDWPVTVPTPIGAFDSSQAVIGKLARAPIAPGQPILSGMLVDKGDIKETHSNASLILDDRERAIAMPIKLDSNVAGAVQAGDRVDIIGTFSVQPTNADGSPNGPATTTTHHLLEDVLVLQVGTWPQPGQETGSNGSNANNTPGAMVTFEVNPQDAEVVKFAQLKGDDISLSLRHANDHTLEQTEPVTMEYLNKRFGYRFEIGGQ